MTDDTPKARHDDLGTSHDAAAKTQKYSKQAHWIFNALNDDDEPLTHDEMYDRAVAKGYKGSPQGIRGCCKWLWREHKVVLFDRLGKSNRGNSSARWMAYETAVRLFRVKQIRLSIKTTRLSGTEVQTFYFVCF